MQSDYFHIGKLEAFGKMQHRTCKAENAVLADKIDAYCNQHNITWYKPGNAYVAKLLVKIRFKSASSQELADYQAGKTSSL